MIVKEDIILMEFLQKQFPEKSRKNIKQLLTNKQVVVDGKIISQYNHLLLTGQKVELKKYIIPKDDGLFGISIVYEDHDVIVINKPEGLLSIATEEEKQQTAYYILNNFIKTKNPSHRVFILHRLDRDTSGLMMFAKSEHIQQQLQDSWQTSILERSYLAIVEGFPEKTKDTISSYLKESKSYMMYSSQNASEGEYAITHYEVLQKNKSLSLLKVSLDTGKKNQIRVHMQDIGHSIIGDKKYGSKINPLNRMGLHAWILTFIHPSTKKTMCFETEMPKAFLRLFKPIV